MSNSMSMIYIIDFDGKVQGVLSNELPSSIPFWEDMYVENIEDAQSTYEFKCPVEGTESIKVENYVAIQDLDGQLVLFKIREIQTYHDTDGKLYKQVFAENAALELLKTIVRPRSFSGVTAEQVLTDILQGTLWQVGNVEITDVNNIEFTDYITAIEAIQNVKDTFGGEIQYRVELNGGQIYKRNIDLLERRGQYTGKRFTYSKDIKSITRTEDTSELYTAVIGLGKADENGNIPTITNTTGTFTNKYGTTVTKYAGQDYIGDPDALARWSDDGQHLMGVYKTEETVPFVILQKTWEFLQQHIEPKLTYEVDVALLEQITGYEHEKARIGDTIIVEDFEFEPALVLEARIVEMGISLADPNQNYVKLSNFVELQISVEQQIQGLLDYIKQKEEMWNSGETIYKGTTPPLNPHEGQLWLDTSTEPNILKNWNGKTWISATPTKPIEIGAEDPQHSQDKADIAALQTEKNIIVSEKAKFNYQVNRLLQQEYLTTQSVKDDLINAKNNYDAKYNAFISAIDNAITLTQNNSKRTAATIARTSSLNTINDDKRAMVDAARIEYQAAVEQLSNAIEAAENEVAKGIEQNATDGVQDYVQEYAERKIFRGTSAPENPAVYDLWLDESYSPPVWKQWDGSEWQKITRDQMSELYGQITTTQISDDAITAPKIAANAITSKHIAANVITSNMISTAGLDAGVIRGGVISGVTIDVDTDATIGSRLNLSYSGPNMSYPDSGISFKDDNGNQMGYIELAFDGSDYFLNTSPLTVSGNIQSYGDIYVSGNIKKMYGGSGGGYCGVGGYDPVGTGGSVAGVGVQFPFVADYVPSSVSLQTRSATATPNVTDITQWGFWLYVTGNGTANSYRYWRGTFNNPGGVG